ncbi:MAG: hypothetical protein AB8I08_21875 [Sandaracinaceae bacterium]
MLHRASRLLTPLAALFVLASCGDTPVEPDCSTDDECAAGQMCVDGACAAGIDAGPDPDAGDSGIGLRDAGPLRTLTGLVLSPSDPVLTAAIGETPTEDFEVVGMFSDGTTGAVAGPTFTVDAATLGFLDEASGVFTANGVIGGVVNVSVSVTPAGGGDPVSASTTLTVRIEDTLLGEGVDATVPAMFDGITPTDDAAETPNIVYPLEGAVMPQNVYPADIQWLRGEATDFVRVTMTKPNATTIAYLREDGMRHWLADAAHWRTLVQTDPASAASIQVTRRNAAGALFEGAAVSVTFARAAVTGSVYYWDISATRIVRINDGTAEAERFMPTPPNSRGGGANCVGCHSVSHDGRYMAGRLGPGQNIGGVFDLTTDLTATPAPSVYPINDSSLQWWFSSWSPDDTRLVVVNSDDGSAGPRLLRFYDPYAGVDVPVSGTLPSGTHPAWSPDGTAIAYVANTNAWGGQNTTGDIGTVDVTGTDTVGDSRIVHTASSLSGATPPGAADSYPTWSPDSARIAFANGTGSRSENMQSALYLMARDGTDVVRLDNANGGATAVNNFQPNFSPFESGGYYWLSFLSRRDYGNDAVGTRGSDFQQIWVTAIRAEPTPGEDPSEVGYWLPGQDTSSRNISAFWAPRACRPDGESCSVGSECCGGECVPGSDGALVCSPPPPERCRAEGETCTTAADCCDDMGLSCLANVCVRAPI